SCGLTLFACTWTAIRPNIPGMDDGKVVVTSRRLFIMAMAMMAPELMITWAAAQFFCAREVAKDFNEWTMTHGFFAWMGGFMLYVNGKPRVTLTPHELLLFVREESVDMPVIAATTLLEIDTLAIATLTCITYCLWWKKPKDIRRPYIVHWKATALPPSDLTYEYVVNILA
ncbi:hypothetical protein BDR05DRAFT_883061, partial [Suillus weaverae]